MWLEMVIASAAGILGIMTIFWRDWIEGLTGWDPDHHNGGSAEWLIVAGLLILAAVAGLVGAPSLAAAVRGHHNEVTGRDRRFRQPGCLRAMSAARVFIAVM